MNRDTLLQAAYDAQPELVEKTAAVIYALEQTYPEFAREVVQDCVQVTDYSLQKTAAGQVDPARMALAVGGSIIAGLGAAVASDMYDAAKKGLTKGRNFRRIMEANPELKQQDKVRLQRAFSSLHGYAPEITADPLVGGALLSHMVNLPGQEMTVIKDALTAQKMLAETKDKSFKPGGSSFSLYADK